MDQREMEKNADMTLVPHPFGALDLNIAVPVLLDPVSPMMDRLAQLQDTGDPDGIAALLHKGWLTVGNEALARRGPPGVVVSAVAWKG